MQDGQSAATFWWASVWKHRARGFFIIWYAAYYRLFCRWKFLIIALDTCFTFRLFVVMHLVYLQCFSETLLWIAAALHFSYSTSQFFSNCYGGCWWCMCWWWGWKTARSILLVLLFAYCIIASVLEIQMQCCYSWCHSIFCLLLIPLCCQNLCLLLTGNKCNWLETCTVCSVVSIRDRLLF